MAINKSDRARQFLPFDALEGLQEALREKEIELEYEEKRELSEEQCEEISKALNKVEGGMKIEVIYYDGKKYVKYKGIVEKIDFIRKMVIFKEGIKVFFDDMVNLDFGLGDVH